KVVVLVIKIINIIIILYSYYKVKSLFYKIAKGYNKYKEYIYYRRFYNRNKISLVVGE
ncbi:hypothetical protein CI102_15238, partial [Trichoderma harzianum]